MIAARVRNAVPAWNAVPAGTPPREDRGPQRNTVRVTSAAPVVIVPHVADLMPPAARPAKNVVLVKAVIPGTSALPRKIVPTAGSGRRVPIVRPAMTGRRASTSHSVVIAPAAGLARNVHLARIAARAALGRQAVSGLKHFVASAPAIVPTAAPAPSCPSRQGAPCETAG